MKENTMATSKKQRKPTKSLRKAKKLESLASPLTFKFRLVGVKTIS
jgi:hypothetical protein